MPTTGNARGTIDGRTARYRYSDSTGRKLDCTASVAADYRSMQERCSDPGSKEDDGQVVTLVRT